MNRNQDLILQAELLENRMMLSGNVNAFLDGEVLVIDGDSRSNDVTVVSDGKDIVVSTRSSLNGQRNSTATFSQDAVKSFDVNLNGGNDEITFIAENDSGVGFGSLDPFEVNGVDSNFNILEIDGSDGNDRINLISRNTGDSVGFRFRNVNIQTGNGNDQVRVDVDNNSSNAGIFARDNLNINTSDGNDQVNFDIANSGSGDGVLAEVLTVFTGKNNDRVNIDINSDGSGAGIRTETIDIFTDTGTIMSNSTSTT